MRKFLGGERDDLGGALHRWYERTLKAAMLTFEPNPDYNGEDISLLSEEIAGKIEEGDIEPTFGNKMRAWFGIYRPRRRK